MDSDLWCPRGDFVRDGSEGGKSRGEGRSVSFFLREKRKGDHIVKEKERCIIGMVTVSSYDL